MSVLAKMEEEKAAMAIVPKVSRGGPVPKKRKHPKSSRMRRYETPPFKCKGDYDLSNSSMSSHVAYVICLLQVLIPRNVKIL